MRSLVFLLLVLGALIVQSTALNYFSIFGVIPDLVLVLAILNGFLRGTREGAFLGFVAGILQDLVSGGYFGVNAITKMVAGYLAGLGEGRLYRENRLIAAALTWLCTFLSELVYYLLLYMINVHVSVLPAIFQIILPVSLYNAMSVLIIYGFYYRSDRSGMLSKGE